jgi:tRNA wybutosine-synthesizing protein 5
MATLLKEIPVVNELSEKDFNTHYFQRNIPIIIKGAMKQSGAVVKWSPAYFTSLFGARKIRLAHSKTGIYNFQKGDAVRVDMPFAEAVSYMEFNNCYYISQSSVKDNYPELMEDINEPVWIAKSDFRRATNLWFGGKGCISPLHFDTSHNFLAQIYGIKHIVLYSPADRRFLYPSENNVSLIDMDRPDDFPLFEHARPYPIRLEPGDVLYLPFYWWHVVESLDMSISVNFWWERFEFIDGVGVESAGVDDVKTMIRRFVDMGLSIDQKNLSGDTNLLKACEKGHLNIVRALLELGADPTIESGSYKGRTALTIAREKGFVEIEKILSTNTAPIRS